MPQNQSNQQQRGYEGYHPHHALASTHVSQQSLHQQKLEYATHEHPGTGAQNVQMHAYSTPYGYQGQQGQGQYGQQTQGYQSQQGQQGQQSQQQQQQMKQQIKQQYQGQYSQLSTKDFNYLKDHMSWELLAAKKCFHYAQEAENPQVADLLNQVGRMHERHFDTLLQYVNPQNVQ